MTNKSDRQPKFWGFDLPDPLSSNNAGKPRVFHTGKYTTPKVTPVPRKPATVLEEDPGYINLEEAFEIEAPPPRDPLLTGAKFYFAYGSNLSTKQMALRCPGATPRYKHKMEGHKLVFRGAADIVKTNNPEDYVPGVIWRILPGHEENLDRFEGVRSGSYRKQTFKFWTPQRNQRRTLVYRNNRLKLKPPVESYLAKVVAGYTRFGLDMEKLSEAVAFAHNNPGMTYHD